jgi:hypothetical protein
MVSTADDGAAARLTDHPTPSAATSATPAMIHRVRDGEADRLGDVLGGADVDDRRGPHLDGEVPRRHQLVVTRVVRRVHRAGQPGAQRLVRDVDGGEVGDGGVGGE